MLAKVDITDKAWTLAVEAAATQARRRLYVDAGLTRCTTRALETLRELYDAVARVNATLDCVALCGPCPEGVDVVVGDAVTVDESPAVEHRCLAVGGTFDRLHAGHRLLLAASALACTDTVYVGIAGDALLKNKKLAHLLQDFDTRQAAVVDFLKRTNPRLEVTVSALLDPRAPPKAATIKEITGLVVSEETVPGAHKVIDMRRDAGIEEPLSLITVGLIGQQDKLSSTALRQKDDDRDCDRL